MFDDHFDGIIGFGDRFDPSIHVYYYQNLFINLCSIRKYIMPLRIPHDIRNQVIRQWLAGEARDKIAIQTGLSAGTISNIVSDWRHKIGYPTADALRQLAVDLKRLGISIIECAIGFRTLSTIKKLGLATADEEKGLESFVSDIYNKCRYYGLQPDELVNLAIQILNLLESIPLSQIPNYLEEKSKDKQKLEEEIKRLLERKVSAQLECEEALQKKKVTIDHLQKFRHTQETLIEYGFSIEDIANLINALNNAQQLGYDANAIVEKISTIESLVGEEKELKNNLMVAQDELRMFKQAIFVVDQEIDKHQSTLAVYEKLQSLGFGLKELKVLSNTIREIAIANNVDSSIAVKKFFQDLEEKNDLTKIIDELKQEKKRREALIDSQFNNAQKFIESAGQEAKKNIAEISYIFTQNLQASQLQTLQTVKGQAHAVIKSLNAEVKTQFEEIQRLGSCQEFSALIRAANGDNSVNIEELKHAGIRTINIIISRLDDDENDSSSNREAKESLEHARISLQSNSS